MGLLRRVQGGIKQRLHGAGAKAVRSRLELAERLAPRSPQTPPGGEQVTLSDGATVQQWLREMRPDVTVMVHRPWGTIAAQGAGPRQVNVFLLGEGTNAWFAVPPEPADDHALTPHQVEHIVLDAMTSADRPAWPQWVELV